jgi:hypothetical protein
VKLVLEILNRGTGIQRILSTQEDWIPACAGMTENRPFKLFTRPSLEKGSEDYSGPFFSPSIIKRPNLCTLIANRNLYGGPVNRNI